MILLAVSAIPPITVIKHDSSLMVPGFLGFPTWKYRAGEITEIEEADKIHPRKLNTTDITLRPLNGAADVVINTRLRYFNINDIVNTEKSENAAYNSKTDLISDLVSAGLSNNIINCWEVPDDYILIGSTDWVSYSAMNTGETNDGYGGYSMVRSTLQTGTIVYTPYSSYAQGVINNKARYGQSASIKVYNPASGASLTKKVYDALKDTDKPGTLSYSLPFRVAADIRPEGCPIFSFVYNDGGTDQLSHATEYIKGGSWRTVPVIAQGLNGSLFDKLALNNAREELNTRTAIAMAGSVLTLGTGLGAVSSAGIGAITRGAGETIVDYWNRQERNQSAYDAAIGQSALSRAGLGALGIAGTAASYVMSSQKLRHQEDMLNARAGIAVAPIQVGNSDLIKDVGMNKFYYVFTSYAGDDMWNFDAFLTRFGYNVGNMPIRNRHFYSRKRFVYVRANEMQVISNISSYYQVNKSILEKVETQLRQGVRIWRTKPDAHYTLPDGNNILEEKAYV